MIATEIRSSSPECTLSTSFVEQLLSAVSLESYAQPLFQLARSQTNCDLLTIFATRGSAAPVCLMNASTADVPMHDTAARAYCERHFRVDPVLLRVLPFAAQDASVRVRYHASDAGDAAYRRDCYDDPRLAERVAFYLRTGGGWTWLNVYRRVGSGEFSDLQIDAVTAFARVFISAVLTRPPATIINQLDEASALSVQEREVLRLSLEGDTAKVIARRLQIEPSTVTTYRKRAYLKLNVRNQRELVAKRFKR